jgi:hypothetical protein
LHLKLCIQSTSQLAHNEVQTRGPMHSSNNPGAIPWGFQQLSPRYGVLPLDALVSNWVQLLQLARRNLRPENGSRRPGCEYTYPVNQPPLAKAPLGSGNERVCADKAVPKGFTAQRACQDEVLGSASRWTIYGSPRHEAEMTSNCNPSSEYVLPKDHSAAVSASISTDGASLSNSQGVHSC